MIRRLTILLLIVGCGTEPQDCAEVTGGTAFSDTCGSCVGGETGLTKNYLMDECGVCGGNGVEENYDCDGNCLVELDCAGVCGGGAVLSGCDNQCGSSAVVDECGVCAGMGLYQNLYNCEDIVVLQSIIDVNESLSGEEPLEIGSQEWVDGKLDSLKLVWGELTSIPESIGNLSSLKGLYLYSNQLTSLPESIGNLSSLEILELSGNQLTTIPESIGNLSSLKNLNLGINQLTTIPESIGNLSSLKKLRLGSNHLTTVPESIGNLSSLERLYLYANQLTTLPQSLCNIPDECHINVSDNHLCEEYRYDCIDTFHAGEPQDQSNCCEGENGEPNWTQCP